MKDYYRHKRRSNWTSKVLLLLVFLIILGYFTDAFKLNLDNASFDNIKEKFSVNSTKVKQPITENQFISDCKKDFNYYSNAFEKKYGMSISISEIKKINKRSEGNEFYQIWGTTFGGPKMFNNPLSGINVFPIVMIAASYKSPEGIKFPMVLVCGSDSKLIESSKQQLIW